MGKSIDLRAQFGRKFTEDEEAFEMAQCEEWMADEMRSYWRRIQRSSWPTEDPGGRCANCGLEARFAKACVVGAACYDGEWCCSTECDAQLTREGCPLE